MISFLFLVLLLSPEHGFSSESLEERSYFQSLESVDFSTSKGWEDWAKLTGTKIVVVKETSDFFYYNLHLLEPQLAEKFRNVPIETKFENGKLSLGSKGELLPLRKDFSNHVHLVSSKNERAFLKGSKEETIQSEAIGPYQDSFEKVPHLGEVGEAIRRLPFTLVQAIEGKAIYLSTKIGRSYAITHPVSNSWYLIFMGLAPGVFFEANSKAQSPRTFVHELCHLLDLTAIENAYDQLQFRREFPDLNALRKEKASIFGERASWVEAQGPGFISFYSRVNPQEDFAEHCMHFILERDLFRDRAVTLLETTGSSLLQRKFDFFEKVFRTSGRHRLTNE